MPPPERVRRQITPDFDARNPGWKAGRGRGATCSESGVGAGSNNGRSTGPGHGAESLTDKPIPPHHRTRELASILRHQYFLKGALCGERAPHTASMMRR